MTPSGARSRTQLGGPQLRGPRSLTARLLVGLLLVCGLGLMVSLVAGTVLLRAYLYDRAGEQVTSLTSMPGSQPGGLRPPQLCAGPADAGVLPSDFRLVVVADDGAVLCDVPGGVPGPPVLGLAELRERAGDQRATVVDGPGGPWSTAVVGLEEDGATRFVVVALSLREADKTVARLTVGGLVICVLVLVAMALAGWWVIRVGLRPLTVVREAARGIRRGDLSARVPDGAPGTEVAELTTALNTMLDEIEQGFEERRSSERRIRQFAADASHELRTPLTSIKGYAQLYAQLTDQPSEKLTPQGHRRPGSDAEDGRRGQVRAAARTRRHERDDVVRRIDSEADRMTAIVEDLLLLARLDQHPQLVREPVDLVEVAHDVLTSARARHPDRRLDLKVTGPVVLVGDSGRLRQVLGNLVSNALVHTASSVSVRIREAPHWAEIDVSDDGPGMREEVRAHVFDRFFRADTGRTRTGAGSGLGLAIVHAVVSAHGGTVTCESSLTEGSTFRVSLPTG